MYVQKRNPLARTEVLSRGVCLPTLSYAMGRFRFAATRAVGSVRVGITSATTFPPFLAFASAGMGFAIWIGAIIGRAGIHLPAVFTFPISHISSPLGSMALKHR